MRHQKAGFRYPVPCHAGLLKVEPCCPTLSYLGLKVKPWEDEGEIWPCGSFFAQLHLSHGNEETLRVSLNVKGELKCPLPTQAWNCCLCCLARTANAWEHPAEKPWKQGMARILRQPCCPLLERLWEALVPPASSPLAQLQGLSISAAHSGGLIKVCKALWIYSDEIS